MNRTQKRIIGWALVAIGAVMVVGVLVNAYSSPTASRLSAQTEAILKKYDLYNPPSKSGFFDLQGLLVNPLFYLGVALGVAGVVVLKGDSKDKQSAG
jgi:hypothetical protein